MDILEWLVFLIVSWFAIPRLLAFVFASVFYTWRISGFDFWLGSLSFRSLTNIRFKFSNSQLECSGCIASISFRFFHGRKPLSLCICSPSIQLTIKAPPIRESLSSGLSFRGSMSQWMSLKLSQILEVCIENLSVSVVTGGCEMLLDHVSLAFRWDLRLVHEFGTLGHSAGKMTSQISAEIGGLQFRLQEAGCFRRDPLLMTQPLEVILDCRLSWLVPTEIVTATITSGDIRFTLDPDVELGLLSKFIETLQAFKVARPNEEKTTRRLDNSFSRMLPKALHVTLSKMEAVIVQDVCRTTVMISQVFASCSTIFAFAGDIKPARVDWSLTLRGPTVDITTSVRSLFHHSNKKLRAGDSLDRLISVPVIDCEFTKFSGNSALLPSNEQQLARSLSFVIVSPRVFAHPFVSVSIRYLLDRVDSISSLMAQMQPSVGSPSTPVAHLASPTASARSYFARDLNSPVQGTLYTFELSVVNFAVSCYASVISETARADNELVDFSNPICRVSFSEAQVKHDVTLHGGLPHKQWTLSLSNLIATVGARPEISTFLNKHAHEHFSHPGQCFLLQTLKLHFGASNKYEASVDGLFFKWSYLVMAAVGPVMRLVLLARPQPTSRSVPQAPAVIPFPRILVARITRLRVDIPFRLELSDEESDLCLFSYVGPKAKAEADITTGHWALQLHDISLQREAQTFVTCTWMRLAGVQPADGKPEMFDIKSRTCRGDWDPALMLSLFKAIKDVVISVVNMKYDIHCLLRSLWPVAGKRMWCRKREVKSHAHNKLHALLQSKLVAVEDFLMWFKVLRDPWLPQPFMLISLDAKDTIVRGVIDQYHLSIEIDSFTSSFIPHQWSFLGCRVRYMDALLLSVDEAHINRVGLSAVDVCANFTEKEHLLMDYLDLNLVFRGPKVMLVPDLILGPHLEHILPRVMGLVQALWVDILTLNELSLRHGGPGYTGPPLPPAPNTFLTIIDLSFVIMEIPLETWLQHLYPIWKEERIEQLRREALLEVRLDVSPSAEQAANLHVAKDNLNARRYVERLEASGIRDRVPSTMLEVKINSVNAEMRLDGPHGNFYSRKHILRAIRDLKLRGGDENLSGLQESVGRSRAPPSEPVSRTNPSQDYHEGQDGDPGSDGVLLEAGVEELEDAGGILAGRIMDVSIEGITVKLRNFTVPLLSLKTVSLSGCCFLEGSQGLTLSRTVPVGTVYTIEIQSQNISSVRVLAELDVRVDSTVLSFAPEYGIALRDVSNVVLKCVPQFSFFVPVVAASSVNLLHVARSCLAGRMGLSLCGTEVLVFPKASEPAHMTLNIADVLLRLDNGLVSVTAKELALLLPQSENHPHMFDVPCIELFMSTELSCRDVIIKDQAHGLVHVCGLHLSISAVLPAKRSKDSNVNRKGLSVSVHSGSLLWLKKVAQSFGSQLPFPNRKNGATKPGIPMLVDMRGYPRFAPQTGLPNVEISGVYLERLMLEQIIATIWEGADLGPARGLKLLLGTCYGSLELVNQGDLHNCTSDEISFDVSPCPKSHKPIIIGGQKLIPIEILDEKYSEEDGRYYLVRFQPPHSQEWHSRETLCEHLELLEIWKKVQSGTPPPPARQQRWSVSNVVAGLSKMELTIVENEKWQEAFDQARRHLSALSSSNSAVVHTYENQRWGLRKWSKAHLLPTDRPAWSNKEGTISVPRHSCMLPDGWEWEGDWQLDHQLRATGQEVDEEGWEYAMDFQRSWSGSPEWYSQVRRRRWIRIRRLKGTTEKDIPVMGPQQPSSYVAALERFELTQKRSQSVPNVRREMFREATRVTINWVSNDPSHGPAEDVTLTDFFRVEKLFSTKILERRAETPLQRRRSITPESPLEMHSVHIESFRLVVNLEIRGIAVALIKQYTSVLHQDDSLPERVGKRRQDSEPNKTGLGTPKSLLRVGSYLDARREWSTTNLLDSKGHSPSPRLESKRDFPLTPGSRNLTLPAGAFRTHPIPEYSASLVPIERSITTTHHFKSFLKEVSDSSSKEVEGIAQEAMFEIRLKDAQVSIDAEDHHGRIVAVVQEQVISGRIGAIEDADISPEPTQSALESNMDAPLEDEEEDSQGQITISRLMDPQSQSKLESVTIAPKRVFDADDMMTITEGAVEEELPESVLDSPQGVEEAEPVIEAKKPTHRVLIQQNLTAQMFIARSDVDVRVGRVWLATSTQGLFQAIMEPLRVNARVVWFLESAHTPILTVNIPKMKFFLDSGQFGLMTGVLASALAPLVPDTDVPIDVQLSQKPLSQLRKEALHVGKVLNAEQWQLRCLQDILPGEIPVRYVDEDDDGTTNLSAEDSVTWNDHNKWAQAKLGQQVSQLTSSCSEAASRRAALVLTLKSRSKPVLPSLPGCFLFSCKLQLENYEFDLMRNGVAFVSLFVKGAKISGSLNTEMSMTFSLEIKSFGARKLDRTQDNKWIEMITQCKLNEKDKSDSWTDTSTTISLRTTIQFYQRPPHVLKALSHVDVNVFPLSFRISSDTVTAVSAFIFNEDAKRETHKFQKTFLPASHTLLEIDVPSAFEIRNPVQVAKQGKAMGNLKDMFGKRDRRASEDDNEAGDELKSEEKQRMSLANLIHRLWNWNAQPENQQASFEVTHFRVGRTYFTLNYTGKKEHSNLEDIQGLRITLKGFSYQKRIWTGQQLLRRLRKDLIYGMLRQTGETLSEFLSYKLGLRKNDDSDSEDEERYPHLPTSHEESRTLLFGERASLVRSAR